jgi:hypothetical protein
MKTRRILVLSILALAAIATPLSARLGGSGASLSFLTMGGGARPIAMGCAYTALADGPDALFWNPAGIARMDRIAGSFGQAILFAGMLEENLALGVPLSELDALGFQVLANLSGPIEITTFEDQHGTGNYYRADNYAAGITYARKMTEKFSAGVSVKVIDLTLHEVTALGFAVDVGATYNLGIRNLRLGFVLQHFGPDMAYKGEPLLFETGVDTLQTDDVPSTYVSEKFPLPFTFAGGLAVDLIEGPPSRLTMALDFAHLSDQPAKGAIGLEYGLNETLFLRLGLGLNTGPALGGEEEDTTASVDGATIIREVLSNRNNRGPSAGLGVKIPVGNYDIAVDYSFEWHWYLAPVHRASLGIAF